MWSAGNAARPFIKDLVASIPEQAAFQKGPPDATKLAVDPYMRVIGAKGLLAIGDNSRAAGRPVPATAQAAAQQGAYVARMLNEGWNIGWGSLEGPPPYRPLQPRGTKYDTAIPNDADSPIAPFERAFLGAVERLGLPVVREEGLTEVDLASMRVNWAMEDVVRCEARCPVLVEMWQMRARVSFPSRHCAVVFRTVAQLGHEPDGHGRSGLGAERRGDQRRNAGEASRVLSARPLAALTATCCLSYRSQCVSATSFPST